jgi:hypothetical protein
VKFEPLKQIILMPEHWRALLEQHGNATWLPNGSVIRVDNPVVVDGITYERGAYYCGEDAQ